MSDPVRYGAPPSDTVRGLQYALELHGIPLPRSQSPSDAVDPRARYDGVPGPETWGAVDAWCVFSAEPWDAQRGVLDAELIERIVQSAPQTAPKKSKKGT